MAKESLISQVNLSNKDVNDENVACTGNQLVLILQEIEDRLPGITWYAVDVLARNHHCLELYDEKKGTQIPLKIGSTQDLVKFAAPVSQFESGIFLAVPTSTNTNIVWSLNSFDTEDQEFIQPAVLIIRAFDTSYFEILSGKIDIIKHLKKRFIQPQRIRPSGTQAEKLIRQKIK